VTAPSSSPRALTALLAGATAIGFAPIFVRLSTEVGPTATAFYRLLLALPPLWLLLAFERKRGATPGSAGIPARHPPRPITRADIIAFAVAGLFFTGDLAMWHWSLQLTSVANSTLLTNFAPLLVTLGAWFLFRERITFTFIAGMLIAIGGAALLVSGSMRFSARHFFGDVIAIATAFFYAGYLLAVKNLRARFSTITIMAYSGVFSTAGFFIVALLAGEPMWPSTARAWLVLAGLALVSHLTGQTLIAYAFGHLPASLSSLNLLLQPVVAAIAAWCVLAEPVTLPQALGAAIVLLGLFIGNWFRR
jgi:drug/metabolite transporter (DMT)-like permease